MTVVVFTYTSPGTSRKDAVRFLVGDTDTTEQFLQDEEIQWLLETWPNKSDYGVAAKVAEAIAAKLSREVTVSADGETVAIGELQQRYITLAEQLREQDNESNVGADSLYVGGMLIGERPDPTVKGLAFGTGMHDFDRPQDYGSTDHIGYVDPLLGG